MSPIPKPHLLGVLAGLFMASGLIVSTTLLTRTWLKVADAESITVTGSARRNVSSDLIVWRGSLTVESPTLLAAQALLAQQETSAREFLIRQGVTNAQFHPIAIQRIQLRTGKQAAEGDTETESSTTRFRLSRAIEVRSGDIDTVLGMDSKTSLLINQGIEFTATTP
jgi:hypothetical protein